MQFSCVPESARIGAEAEEGAEHGVRIINSLEDLLRITIECTLAIKERLDLCGDHTIPQVIVEAAPVKDAYVALSKRGGKIRFITEITKENILYCREIMRFAELRHIDDLMVGGWGVSELDYIATVPRSPEKVPLQPVQGLHSKVPEVLKLQKFIVDSLWEKATPASQRIKEIEKGITREFIEVRKEKADIEGIYYEVLGASKREILIVFPDARLFHERGFLGLQSILDAIPKTDSIKVRILGPVDHSIKQSVSELQDRFQIHDILVRSLEPDLLTKVLLLIVDRSFALAVELKAEPGTSSSSSSLDESVGLSSYSNSAATVLTYASVFESLWKQSEMYEHIRFLYEQLSAHDKMQEEFINIAAHELRNPVQPIIGLAEILRESAGAGSQQYMFLDAILRNARRLQKLQEDILDVTRIESGLLKLQLTHFNLKAMIIELLGDFERNNKSKNDYYKDGQKNNDDNRNRLVFDVKISDGLYVYADRERMGQVIVNLLSNAVKFTKNGTIFVRTKRQRGKDSTIILTIRDTGTGIDPEILPKLFAKFVSKSERGTGLGLYISKRIVESHGGTIWAENNRSGKGASFSFSIPMKKKEQETEQPSH